ncbi:MAG: hypothetical protein ISR79_02625 [Nitrosopumilus sp.]|nr:hypothetical protein [Nitrosopumilus sp.]
MSEQIVVENLPVLFNNDIAIIGQLRMDLKDGVFDRTETPILDMMNSHESKTNENIEYAREQEVVPRNSANIESLFEFIQIVDHDMRYAMHPPFDGKIRNDHAVKNRLEKYYKVSVKKYARTFKIYFDGLIQYDNYPASVFDDYQRLVKLVENTDDEIADEYLLKLSTIAKQMIPMNLHIENSYVVDSNSVDINKVNE